MRHIQRWFLIPERIQYARLADDRVGIADVSYAVLNQFSIFHAKRMTLQETCASLREDFEKLLGNDAILLPLDHPQYNNTNTVWYRNAAACSDPEGVRKIIRPTRGHRAFVQWLRDTRHLENLAEESLPQLVNPPAGAVQAYLASFRNYIRSTLGRESLTSDLRKDLIRKVTDKWEEKVERDLADAIIETSEKYNIGDFLGNNSSGSFRRIQRAAKEHPEAAAGLLVLLTQFLIVLSHGEDAESRKPLDEGGTLWCSLQRKTKTPLYETPHLGHWAHSAV